MARWNILPFMRFQNRSSTLGFEPEIESFDLHIPKQSFSPSIWGCEDELGTATCHNIPELFADDEDMTCRWPLAELCLSTCGQCPLVEAARQCTSHHSEIHPRLTHGETIDWQEFFESITSPNRTEPYARGSTILSRESPWVAIFPNYLTESEADELVRIARLEGYRIEDEHPKHIRDVNVTNCDSIRCMRQPFVSELYRRVSSLLDFHPNQFESMEFIDYSPGQHYSWHADEYSWKYPVQDPLAVLAGPRLLTMFHYLSDVEEGGETAFAGPDPTGRTKRLAVSPKKGTMILWANMQPSWRISDHAAVHSALPVRKGRKLAGTIWIHASGFRIPELYAGADCNPRNFYNSQ